MAKFLFVGFAASIVTAVLLLHFEPSHPVETVSDLFHPERGAVVITPLTVLEQTALWIMVAGAIALVIALVFLLRSLYSRGRGTPII